MTNTNRESVQTTKSESVAGTPASTTTTTTTRRIDAQPQTAGATGLSITDKSALPGWLKLLGGLTGVVSMFLPWLAKKADEGFKPAPGTTTDDVVNNLKANLNGIDTDAGKAVLILSIVLAVMGLLWLLNVAKRAAWIPALGLLASLGILGTALYYWTNVGSWITKNWPDTLDQAQQTFLHASPGAGIWVALIGGLLGLIGSLIALMTRRKVVVGGETIG